MKPGEAARIRSALAGVEGLDAERARLLVVARRPGRLTVRARDGESDLAVTLPRAGARGGPRAAEIARALEAAAGAGIAPRLRLLDRGSGILVTDWAAGAAWNPEDLASGQRLGCLAGLLRTLHGLAAGIPPFDVVGWSRHYRQSIARLGSPLDERESRALDELRDLATEHHRTRSTATLGHNDVTAGNLIGFPQPLLIDWEYAGASDPAFDLATVIALHGLDDRAGSMLLDAYEAAGGTAVERGWLARTERLVKLLAWAWAYAEALAHPGDPRATSWRQSTDPF